MSTITTNPNIYQEQTKNGLIGMTKMLSPLTATYKYYNMKIRLYFPLKFIVVVKWRSSDRIVMRRITMLDCIPKIGLKKFIRHASHLQQPKQKKFFSQNIQEKSRHTHLYIPRNNGYSKAYVSKFVQQLNAFACKARGGGLILANLMRILCE